MSEQDHPLEPFKRATTATIRVFVKPMIMWLWLGGLLMAIGTAAVAQFATRAELVECVGLIGRQFQ